MSMKNSSDTIGNRTRDLPACSALPQPTALTRALHPSIRVDTIIGLKINESKEKETDVREEYESNATDINGGELGICSCQMFKRMVCYI